MRSLRARSMRAGRTERLVRSALSETGPYVPYWWKSLEEIEKAATQPMVEYAGDYDDRRRAFGLESRSHYGYSNITNWWIPALFAVGWLGLVCLNISSLRNRFADLLRRFLTGHSQSQDLTIHGTSDGMAAQAQAHSLIGISLEAWLTIAAVILGPILALYAQPGIDWRAREFGQGWSAFPARTSSPCSQSNTGTRFCRPAYLYWPSRLAHLSVGTPTSALRSQ